MAKNDNFELLFFILLIAVGLALRMPFLWHPDQVVFDEVHFGQFVSAYYTGEYYFDIHPPLGKLLIAGFAYFFEFKAGFDFANIGAEYGDIPYAALRFLPNLAGALIPAAVVAFLLVLGIPKTAAFIAGALLTLDGALLVQSRFILVDAFLILFGFAGLWLFFRARNRGYRIWDLILAGAVLALSFSVKWTGLAFFGLAIGVMLWDFWRGRASGAAAIGRAGSGAGLVLSSALFIVATVTVYLAVFWVHFALLPNPGPGDAFMSRNFQEQSFLAQTLELNLVMFAANHGLEATHPDASSVWSWPLMAQPIFYWVENFENQNFGKEPRTAWIYLLGNPIVWWLSTIGFFAGVFFWRPKSKMLAEAKWILYAGWLMHTLPFLGIQRVVFLYHYLPALVFAVAIFSAWLCDALPRVKLVPVAGAIIGLAAIAFIFFAPLSYGLPLTEKQYTMRLLLPWWR